MKLRWNCKSVPSHVSSFRPLRERPGAAFPETTTLEAVEMSDAESAKARVSPRNPALQARLVSGAPTGGRFKTPAA